MTRILRKLAALAALWALGASAQTVHTVYEYSDEDFPNPERGLFKHIDLVSSQGNSLSSASLKNYRQQGYTIVYTGYILDIYRNGNDLSQNTLKLMRNNMNRLRDAGLKAVVRFYYSADSNNKPWDASLETTLRHIEQLKPVLQENSDVILAVEAGFVGTWGEWYQTENHTFNPQSQADYANRKAIVEALADAVPADRLIALRTPMYKMGILNAAPKDTLTAETAYNGSLAARLGFHNDCFLANADDAGTFQNSRDNRNFTMQDSRYTIMGGETCSDPNTYTAIVNARSALRKYHWTYLNSDYHPGTLGQWTSNGFMDEIKRNLGYRLCLLEADYPQSVRTGCRFAAEISLQNLGWAAPVNPRNVELVFVGADGTSHTHRLDIDPRRWQPGFIHTLSVDLSLADDMPLGPCRVYLNLPAPEEKIHDRPEYSIRLANTDCWDAATGMNLLTTIDITAADGVADPAADPAAADAAIYDIAGRRVGTVGQQSRVSPGIYIIGGHKYLLH